MKKVFIYFIFLLMIFFFEGSVYAIEYDISVGDSISIDISNYENFSCSTDDLSVLEFVKNNIHKATVSYLDTSVYEDEGYFETLDCSYTDNFNTSFRDGGNVSYKFNINSEIVNNITLNLVKDNYPDYNLFENYQFSDKKLISNISKIISFEEVGNNKYFSYDCPTDSLDKCLISINDKFLEEKQEISTSKYLLNYLDDVGKQNIVKINVVGFSSRYVTADFGGYGVCEFDSSWTKINDSNTTVQQVVSVGESLRLPTCSSDTNNHLLKFEGWIDLSKLDTVSVDVQRVDLCKNYINVQADMDVLIGDNSTFYYACYGTKEGVILNLNEGQFDLNDSSVVSEGVAYVDSEGDYRLPDVEKIPKVFSEYGNARFIGWRDLSGTTYSSGSTVNSEGQIYYATFSSEPILQTVAYTIERQIHIDNPEVISMDKGIVSCTSNNPSVLMAIASNNECIIKGNSVTDGGTVKVTITYSDGSSVVVDVSVLPAEGEMPDSSDIDLDGSEDFSTLDTATEETYYGTISCDTYKLWAEMAYKSWNIAKHNGYNLHVTQYRAKSKCDADADELLGLCMDPGRAGPNYGVYTYYLDKSFDPNTEFGKLVRHIVKDLNDRNVNVNQVSDDVAAANVALRIIQYYSLGDLSSSSILYQYHVDAYKAQANSLKSACTGGIVSCSRSTIYNALNKWSWSGTSIRNKVADILARYDGVGSANDSKGIKVSSKIESVNIAGTIDVLIAGTVKFDDPTQMSSFTMSTDCPHFTCSIVDQSDKNLVTGEWNYKMKLVITSSNVRLLDDLEKGEKPAIVLTDTSGDTLFSVFLLKPKSSNLQRMVIFNTESAKIRAEVTTNFCAIYSDVIPVNPSDPCIPDKIRPGSSSFDKETFKNLGCCAYLEDGPQKKDICGETCYYSNFDPYCDPLSKGNTNASYNGMDTYSMREGYSEGITDDKKKFSCIVDVNSNVESAIDVTGELVDFAGNKHLVHENKYCAISCREEWDISMPAFNSFIGDNAVRAGNYFIMKDIFIGTTRQCFSTYFDYEAYNEEQQNLSKEIMKIQGGHAEFTRVYSNLKANQSQYTDTYNTYYYNSSEDYHCHDTDNNGEGSQIYDGCARYDDYVFEIGGVEFSVPYCAQVNPCSHVCHVWHAQSHSCTIYVVENKNTTYKYSERGSHSVEQSGVNKGEIDSYTKNTKSDNTIASNIGESNGAIDKDGGKLKSHLKEGSMPPANVDYPDMYNGVCCGGGENYNCGGVTADHNYLMNNALYTTNSRFGYSGNVKKSITELADLIRDKLDEINENADSMALCQNYFLKNDTTDSVYSFNKSSESADNYSGVTSGYLFKGSTILKSKVDGYEISTIYEPKASYEYEEMLFMELLSKDSGANIIVPDDSKNVGVTAGNCVATTLKDENGNRLELCRSGKKQGLYNPNGDWNSNDDGKLKYHVSGDETNFNNAKTKFSIPICITGSRNEYEYNESTGYCEDTESPLYKIHYMSKSLANSSYFRNKGSWWQDAVTDGKGHGDTKTEAVANNPGQLTAENTGLYGAKYNVFPIALDTPENIYQYTYAFKDIGMYPDGKPGRIMGNGNLSMYANNERTCFYQVFEEACICCGDPILFYTYSSKVEVTDDYLDKKVFIDPSTGLPFDPAKDNYSSTSSYINIVNSVVSLYNLKGSDGTIADNWSSNDKFLYEGKILTTNKGAELLKAITKKGEVLYDYVNDGLKPEYSYLLTPTVLAKVRDYNLSGYGYTTKTIDLADSKRKICFKNGASCPDEAAGFFHIESKFLKESFMKNAITPEFRSFVINNRSTASSCYVSNAENVYSSSYSNCKWIDYVETTPSGTFRLALK